MRISVDGTLVFKYPVIRVSKFSNAGQTLSSKQHNKMIYFFDVVSAIIHSRSRSTKNILAAETVLEELQQKDLDMVSVPLNFFDLLDHEGD